MEREGSDWLDGVWLQGHQNQNQNQHQHQHQQDEVEGIEDAESVEEIEDAEGGTQGVEQAVPLPHKCDRPSGPKAAGAAGGQLQRHQGGKAHATGLRVGKQHVGVEVWEVHEEGELPVVNGERGAGVSRVGLGGQAAYPGLHTGAGALEGAGRGVGGTMATPPHGHGPHGQWSHFIDGEHAAGGSGGGTGGAGTGGGGSRGISSLSRLLGERRPLQPLQHPVQQPQQQEQQRPVTDPKPSHKRPASHMGQGGGVTALSLVSPPAPRLLAVAPCQQQPQQPQQEDCEWQRQDPHDHGQGQGQLQLWQGQGQGKRSAWQEGQGQEEKQYVQGYEQVDAYGSNFPGDALGQAGPSWHPAGRYQQGLGAGVEGVGMGPTAAAGDAQGPGDRGSGLDPDAPWWHLLPDFVPVAALTAGRDPR